MTTFHTDREFEKDLTTLRELLVAMAAKAQAQIADAIRALQERDSALCQRIIDGDQDVNRLELEVDTLCRKVLALRQPAASDLRFITTALKIVTDLERVGDLAVNIAERVTDLNEAPPLSKYQDIPKLAELAQSQVKAALDAFVHGDVEASRAVIKGDDHLDALYLRVFNELLAFMLEDPRNIRRATSLMFVAKHLERIGDHASNVAEMTIYMVQGKDVRHPRSRGVA
jgi:phosphate transport system protein